MSSTAQLVSIVIPCYRQGHLLPQSVDSALTQRNVHVQVIVVNDGSNDNTNAVAESYGDRIVYIKKENGGLVSARNAGIARAQGNYFVFLDSDDLLRPTAVRCMLDAMDGKQDRLVAMGWQEFQDETMGAVHQHPEANLAELLFANNLGPPHAWLSSRRMVELLKGFDPALYGGCEDWDFWLRQVFAGAELTAIAEVGALYRVSANSMSHNTLMMDANRAILFRRVLEWIDAMPDRVAHLGVEPNQLRLKYRRRSVKEHSSAAYGFRERHQYRHAASHYLQAFLHGGMREGLVGLLKIVPHSCKAIMKHCRGFDVAQRGR